MWLLGILILAGAAIWMILNPAYPVQPGLDLQGGLQVLLEADVPEDQPVSMDDMTAARQIISQRVNALGVAEPLVQIEGERRILVELPGIEDTAQAIDLIQETALLEFIDTGANPLPEGTCVRTTLNEGRPSPCEEEDGIGEVPTFETILTGGELRNASAEADTFGRTFVAFEMSPEGGETLGAHTAANVGRFLTIVLDKRVISSPRIQDAISDQGTITGDFTLEEARNLALQLRFGRLPVPLAIESTREIGATLGQRSVEASVRAGVIGVAIVLLFMAIYYRVPGVLADVALILYALINFAIFKWLSVTLTLPAVTGFLLSTGMAVDANILIFERMKEELRRGSSLRNAITAGFSRAWASIRDSNVSTLVVCLVLWGFGRNFGASMVQGFAITLAIGVTISMFTAVVVTRTFVNLILGRGADWFGSRRWLLGA
ncbi:MAG TPA: protein translocase subunit SecD [Candidatus Sulfomarinibacteraceae bacterium]|nr:protein translocase subunit SecD [Candidatus Sulfomarinibacteraceae bacterium]